MNRIRYWMVLLLACLLATSCVHYDSVEEERVLVPRFKSVFGYPKPGSLSGQEPDEREVPLVQLLKIKEVALVGFYRYPDPFWDTTIRLGSDRTFLYNQLTDTFNHTEFSGTWSLVAGYLVVKSSALKDGAERYLIVRSGSEIGLLEESSLVELRDKKLLKFIFEQTCWKSETEPNQSLEPTGIAVTPSAGAEVAPAIPVAHH